MRKDQGKINFRIVWANFRKNLHLAVSAYYSILSTSREFIFSNALFMRFLSFFHLLLVFFFFLYFLFENDIDPVISLIMTYCICIENENN